MCPQFLQYSALGGFTVWHAMLGHTMFVEETGVEAGDAEVVEAVEVVEVVAGVGAGALRNSRPLSVMANFHLSPVFVLVT